MTLAGAVSKNFNLSMSYNVKGRARRSEFWLTVLLCILVSSIFDGATYLCEMYGVNEIFCIALVAASANVYTVGFCCLCRRMHDIGSSCVLPSIATAFVSIGFLTLHFGPVCLPQTVADSLGYFLLSVAALISLYVLFLCCKDSEKGKNRFGYSDKYVDPDDNPALMDKFWQEYGNKVLEKIK